METINQSVHQVAVLLSRMLEPLAIVVDIINFSLRQQLTQFGVPYNLQTTLISVLWTVILFVLLRTLTGWTRLAAIVALTIALLKVYGYLPSA